MLGYLPGLLHAWYIIAKFPENDYDSIPADAETGRVTYVIVQSPSGGQQRAPKQNDVQGQGPSAGYGTTTPMVPQAPQVHQDTNGQWTNAGEGSSAGVPPTYAEAVQGDHKIQTQN